MKIKYLILIFILFPFCSVFAQSAKEPAFISSFTVGDKVPDVVLNNIFNSNKSTEKLSGFNKNRLLIIDFFATWCVPCVRALPGLDAFQKKMGDHLQIIVVSREKSEIITGFLQKNPTVQGTGLPFIAGDSVLSNMFPHTIVPHEIWIDADGIVKAITSHEEVTEKNIMAFLDKKPLDLPLKKEYVDFDINVPLFKYGNGGDGYDFLARSILTKDNKGLPGKSIIFMDSNKRISRTVFLRPMAVQLFFAAAYSYKLQVLNFKRIVFNNRDSAIIQQLSGLSDLEKLIQFGSKKEKYCYELSLPQAVPDTAFFKYMMEDLNRYFDIKGSVEKRTIPCWVLVRTSKDDKLLESKEGKIIYAHSGKMRNAPLSGLTYYLNQFFQVEPVLDETGFTKPVDMDFTFSRNINEYPDIEAIRKDLNKYGLNLVKQPRSVDVLVITDKHS